MRHFLVILAFVFCTSAFSQKDFPFREGERVTYTVYYNLAWIWVDAAVVEFSVSDAIYQNNSVFFFKSKGYSKPNYDWIYTVRDTFTSFASKKDISPLWYKRNTKEGSHIVNNYYLFSQSEKKVFSYLRDSNEDEISDTLSFKAPLYDVLSASYFFRSVDFENKKIGDTISINTIMDNEFVQINVVYLGEELLEHKNKRRYPTYKFKTKAVGGSVFDEDSEIVVWISKDKNRIPLKVQSEILVGSVIAYISTVENPKDKTSEIIKDFIK